MRVTQEKSAILIISLWLLVILSIFSLGLSHRMSIELKLNQFYRDKTKVFYISTAGIKKVISEIKKDTNPYDSLNELWSLGIDPLSQQYLFKDIELGEGIFNVNYVFSQEENETPVYFYGSSDEERRINVNIVAQDNPQQPNLLLFYLFMNLGIDESDANILSDSIKDWIDTDDNTRTNNGAENDYYMAQQPPYRCRNGQIKMIEELRLVKGMTDEYFNQIKDYLTTFGSSGKININTVSLPVLTSLFMNLNCDIDYGAGFSQALASTIISARSGAEGAGTLDDLIFNDLNNIQPMLQGTLSYEESAALTKLAASGLIDIKSNYYRIHCRANIKNGRITKTIEAIVNKDAGSNQKIVFWHEN